MNALQMINHKTSSWPPIVAKRHIYTVEPVLEYCMALLDSDSHVGATVKALLRFLHMMSGTSGAHEWLRYEGKGAVTRAMLIRKKHRPLSSAILGLVDDAPLLRHSPQIFSGGGVSRFAGNNPPIPKGRHLGYPSPSSVVRVCEAVYW